MQLQRLLPIEGESSTRWMVHVSSDMLKIWLKDFLSQISAEKTVAVRHLQQHFYIIEFSSAVNSRDLLQTVFPRWICPVLHQWPTSPQTEIFVEKAAQGLFRKFGVSWQHLEILSTTAKLKRVAIGLKGRILQIKTQKLRSQMRHDAPAPAETTGPLNGHLRNSGFSKNTSEHSKQGIREQLLNTTTDTQILAVLLDEKGLFAGLAQNRLNMGSALSGGLGFLSEKTADNAKERVQLPSRAGGKIREVLALLDELNFSAAELENWLELGAAPGGMTKHLLNWGTHVTAVDLAEMSADVLRHPSVKHLKIHAQEIKSAHAYHALLCDMNGPYQLAAKYVANLAQTMSSGSLVIYTLKLTDINEARCALDRVSELFARSGISLICAKHLFHNRQEITLIAERN